MPITVFGTRRSRHRGGIARTAAVLSGSLPRRGLTSVVAIVARLLNEPRRTWARRGDGGAAPYDRDDGWDAPADHHRSNPERRPGGRVDHRPPAHRCRRRVRR